MSSQVVVWAYVQIAKQVGKIWGICRHVFFDNAPPISFSRGLYTAPLARTVQLFSTLWVMVYG